MDWRENLIRYLATQLPSASSISIARVFGMPAGASNETAALELRVACDGVDAPLTIVVRPQRSDGILAPYDVSRQFRVMRALSRTPVPVPAVCWLESDPTILGAPFVPKDAD